MLNALPGRSGHCTPGFKGYFWGLRSDFRDYLMYIGVIYQKLKTMQDNGYITDSAEVLREYYDLFLLQDTINELEDRLKSCYSFLGTYTPDNVEYYEGLLDRAIEKEHNLTILVSN